MSAAGTLVGLEAPPAGIHLEVKPYAIGGLTPAGVEAGAGGTPESRFERDGKAGVDLKYGITQNLTADFTYNTDFAQVEVDEQQVNLTRFNLFFPEKAGVLPGRARHLQFRPRQLPHRAQPAAGAASWAGGDAPTMFYSRRIGLQGGQAVPILGGGRLTGKVGAFDVGALNIQTGNEAVSGALDTNFTVLRVKRDMLRRSSIGGIVTNRSLSLSGDGSNQAYGADAVFSFFDSVNLLGYYAKTSTTGVSGRDSSYQARFDYGADRYGLEVDHLLVEGNFRPEVGFLRRRNFRRTSLSGRFSPRPRSIESVRQFVLEASHDYFVTADTGFLETRQNQVAFQTELENSDQFGVRLSDSYELLQMPFFPVGRRCRDTRRRLRFRRRAPDLCARHRNGCSTGGWRWPPAATSTARSRRSI